MRILFFFFALSIYNASVVCAQQWLGTKTPYRPLQKKYTPAPAGYQPVFINHVGRHGSRFLTKPGSDLIVLAILQTADDAKSLRPAGNQVKKVTELFAKAEKDHYEYLTLLGYEEQQAIARRMQQQYNGVFKGNGLEIQMTHKKRTQQSADGFLQGLQYAADRIHRFILPDTLEDALRFYDLSPAYQAYSDDTELQQRADSLLVDPNTQKVAARVSSKLFTPAFVKKLTAGITIDINGKSKIINSLLFTQSLYDVYSMQFVAAREIKQLSAKAVVIGLTNAFTNQDLQWLEKTANASDFFEKGPATDILGIQVKIAAPLLVDFINSVDSIINGSKVADASLRFTHAEAISPLATLLGIPQASITANSVNNFDKYWQASSIIPMSANIQWIVYSNGKDYLVKMLLNEKEVAFPVTTAQFPYYSWAAVKAYYVEKLSKLSVNLQSDMHQYLLDVK